MKQEPQSEHHWLHKMVGDWTNEGEASMGPDKPPMHFTGTETVRSIGGLWIVAEGQGGMPGESGTSTLMTLGYDSARKRFVGTFVASMMTHLWIYDGALDVEGRKVVLETEGPGFSGDGTMAKYRDRVEFVNDDHRILASEILLEDGSWSEFMKAHYRRKA